MKQMLFEGFTDEQRIQMLEDNCDAIVNEKYTKRFTGTERNERRKRNAEIDLELAIIAEDEKAMKEQIKERKKPLLEEKAKLLEEIKMNGKYVEGRVFKFIDREAKEVGYYDEDAFLVEQRKMTNADKQISLHLPATGTDD